MSIEALIREQIEALKANTAAVLLLEASLVGRAGGNSKPAKEEKPKVVKAEDLPGGAQGAQGEIITDDELEEKNERRQAAIEEAAAVTQQLAAEREGREVAASGVEYGTVRELVLKLAPTKREEIKALNAKFGIANLKVLLDKEDDFSTVNDQTKLDAIYAELQKLEA